MCLSYLAADRVFAFFSVAPRTSLVDDDGAVQQQQQQQQLVDRILLIWLPFRFMLCWLIVLVVSGHGSNKLSKLSLRHPWTQVRQFVEWKFSRRAHFTKPLRTTRDRVYTYVSCLVLSCRSFMSVISRFEFRWFGQWWWMKEKFLAKLDFYSRFRLLSRRLGNERHTLPTGEQHGRKINIMTSRRRRRRGNYDNDLN